ncbi:MULTISPECIES: JAB domain-containing protein [Stenotrophomonas]|uniref:JAB domain-containing protein n=1 Tax=Stenotrophomonas TaxID=40323 RepID=UPI001CF4507C|nr:MULTISPECIES: JAB domain-containing protein [Stenotrophomonas]MCA7024939.1 JAB domain-containing protein [Stenotrophomonas acidaminiphila]MCE4074628.1 JAB domain-containing protein [Stenotrophomonas acidaminiphila]
MQARSRVRAPTAARAVSSIGARALEDRAIVRALRLLERRILDQGACLSDVATCSTFFRMRLGGEAREHFEVAFLDTRHCLLAVERLFSGSIDRAEVHPRIVVQRALALNAAAVLLAHNHPSGQAEPSEADRVLTTRLKAALGLVDIRLLDHFVVTAREAISMATRGFI